MRPTFHSEAMPFGWRRSVVGGVCFIILPFLCVAGAFGQVAPEDTSGVHEVELSAESLEGFVQNGETVRRLVGQVRLRQEETTLTSEEAIQYPDRDDMLFTGSVRIVDEGDTLWADRVLYNRSTKIGNAEGDVVLSDGEVRLNAPSGVYFLDEKRAELEGGIRMVDSTAVLTSARGQYWLDEKRAEFYEDVLLVEEQSTLQADSVTYFRETEIALGKGNVFIEHLGGEEGEVSDSTARTYLFGETAYNDNRTGFSRIEGQPLLVQLDEDTTNAMVDTLVVRARVLESTRTDSLDRLIAIDSVRIWQQDLAAVADSVVSDRMQMVEDSTETRDEIRFYGSPAAWLETSQITGDTLVARARSGTLDSLLVFSSAFVAQQDTVLDRIQQLRGRDMVALFSEDSLRTLYVGPNAEAIHYLKDDADALKGAVQVSGDEVRFWFERGEIWKIKVTGDNEGTQYDAGLIPESFNLEGFRWMPGLRPEKEALLEGAGERLPPAVSPVYTSAEAP